MVTSKTPENASVRSAVRVAPPPRRTFYNSTVGESDQSHTGPLVSGRRPDTKAPGRARRASRWRSSLSITFLGPCEVPMSPRDQNFWWTYTVCNFHR
ncbi:hypothetical protein RRG08_017545 [Elysia crispata]|uniref:Uncharacterized protein n=1 Tax=Elysia crispata TaxID=231223 RepID=A0AAE1BA21_9GAST|nr:hypothetical protein RRG08_017545 [Elysia crispata]